MAAALLLTLAGGLRAAPVADYMPNFTVPKVIDVTQSLNDLPALDAAGKQGGMNGAFCFTMHSLAGLVDRQLYQGKGDALVYLNRPDLDSYQMWIEKVFEHTGAQRVDMPDSLAMIRKFAADGIVKGYILYRADPSTRNPYDAIPDEGEPYNNSINVATSLAGGLGAIIVEESIEPAIKDLGLTCLLDVRDKDERWCFDNYKDTFSKKWLCVIDPKTPNNRDLAIACDSLVVFGVNELTDQVMVWLDDNAPVIGWNGGDEYSLTSEMSRHAVFNTASNWCLNLPVTSSVTAGEQIPWRDISVPARTHADPYELEWLRDCHVSSFVMSDGDNNQWYMGGFFTNTPNYWNAERRGSYPLGWPSPCVDLAQISPVTLEYMSQTATANDQLILQAGGYFYADEYGDDVAGGHTALMGGHVDQLAGSLEAMDVRIVALLLIDWKSPKAMESYELYAKKVDNLVGILTFQYYPYTAGEGEILWVENAHGEPIPVISCDYALWAGVKGKGLLNSATPAWVASEISKKPHQGDLTDSEFFDWTIIHAWSAFRHADTSKDLWAEDLDQSKAADYPDRRCGVDPGGWCVDQLADHVRVVSPEEMIWQVRLHLKTRPTLDGLAARMLRQGDLPTLVNDQLAAYRTWLKDAPLETDEAKADAYERLKRIRRGSGFPFPNRIN